MDQALVDDRRQRFENLYLTSIDPWKFRTSEYERDKYQRTLAELPRHRYRTVIEAGCSIGELSRLLAERCDHFYGVDISQTAIDEAQKRNVDMTNMRFYRAELPEGWPDFAADLVVLSEFLYFLTVTELDILAESVARTWRAGGDCAIVSYLDETSEALQGAQSADIFISALRKKASIAVQPSVLVDHYRIDILQKL